MVGVHTLHLNHFCPMEHHHNWFPSEFIVDRLIHTYNLCASSSCKIFLPCSRPGSLKRGMTSLMEESIMKRSRTSSISSGTGFHAPRGTPGTTRNPIHSSYSSTLGLSQVELCLLCLCVWPCRGKVQFLCFILCFRENDQHPVPLCPALDHLAPRLQKEL